MILGRNGMIKKLKIVNHHHKIINILLTKKKVSKTGPPESVDGKQRNMNYELNQEFIDEGTKSELPCKYYKLC